VNYLDEIGGRIRAEVPPGDLPHDDTTSLFRLYAVLLLAKGEEVTAADVHNAWSAWMADRDDAHESLVPYVELPSEVSAQDRPYIVAIQTVARALARSRASE
jgi:ABC-type oligopeptide transport system substrate-binding subunit